MFAPRTNNVVKSKAIGGSVIERNYQINAAPKGTTDVSRAILLRLLLAFLDGLGAYSPPNSFRPGFRSLYLS
jgi:hypothetical protein